MESHTSHSSKDKSPCPGKEKGKTGGCFFWATWPLLEQAGVNQPCETLPTPPPPFDMAS